MSRQARLTYIDIAKGFAMLLVIIGHCAYSDKHLIGWLYSFHMPLFFALSGFTFRPEKYKSLCEVVVIKFRQLVIPYFILNLLLWALCLILLDGMRLQYRHINEFIGIFLSKRLSDYFFSLWFLNTLFLAEPLLWTLIRGVKGHSAALALLSLALYAIGAVVMKTIKGAYWSADLVPVALSFLIIGYLIGRFMKQSRHTPLPFGMLALVWGVNLLFFVLNYMQVGRSDLYFSKLGNPLYFFLSACAGTFGAIALCQRINRCKALEYIGRCSLIFYAFESLAIPLAEQLLESIWDVSSLQSVSLLSTLLVVILSCAMLALAGQIHIALKRRLSKRLCP